MRSQRILGAGLLAFVIMFVLMNGATLAHHSRAHYGTEEVTTIGTVVEYKWRNPHVFVVYEAKDTSGNATQWIGEMAAVTSMLAQGLTKNSLKPGEQVTISGFRSKNPGSTDVLVRKITKANGTVVLDNSRDPNLRQP